MQDILPIWYMRTWPQLQLQFDTRVTFLARFIENKDVCPVLSVTIPWGLVHEKTVASPVKWHLKHIGVARGAKVARRSQGGQSGHAPPIF